MLFCLSATLFAQYPSGPEYNPVMDFIEENLGEKVGKGICFDLVEKAFKKSDKRWYKDKWARKSKYKVDPSEVAPGDVILFHSCTFSDGSKSGYHIAFVYEINSDSSLTIAEQNSCDKDELKRVRYKGQYVNTCDQSVVELCDVDLSTIVRGRVSFYRF